MEFELKPSKTTKELASATLDGKKYFVITKVKARHIVQVEDCFGTKIGEVQKGLRILAQLLYEAMGEDGLTYEALLEYDIVDLEPLLELVK